jgi:hypothetical protein
MKRVLVVENMKLELGCWWGTSLWISIFHVLNTCSGSRSPYLRFLFSDVRED